MKTPSTVLIYQTEQSRHSFLCHRSALDCLSWSMPISYSMSRANQLSPTYRGISGCARPSFTPTIVPFTHISWITWSWAIASFLSIGYVVSLIVAYLLLLLWHCSVDAGLGDLCCSLRSAYPRQQKLETWQLQYNAPCVYVIIIIWECEFVENCD